MISNHVTCFILFYSIGWTSLLLVFFSCFPSFPSESSLASQNAFSLVWLRHGSSSWTTLVYIFFDFIYGGGGVVCFLECWEVSAPSPSLSVPPLAVPKSPPREGPGPVPVLHPLVWLVPVWMCSLCSRSAAQYFPGFNCSLVGRWNPAEGQAAI